MIHRPTFKQGRQPQENKPQADMGSFDFLSYQYDLPKSTLYLHYKYENDPRTLTEEWVFHGAKKSLNDHEKGLLERCFFHLHLVAGISYYKSYLPSKLNVSSGKISKKLKSFLQKFYYDGLGEFRFLNNIPDIPLDFPTQESNRILYSNFLKKGMVVPVGGGKDSTVTLEAMKAAQTDNLRALVIGNYPTHHRMIEMSGIDKIHIERKISPVIFDYNEKGAYNGHVPITGILSFAMLCAAVLYGFKTVAMSNERSASEENIEWNNGLINHQWSKSFEFEQMFSDYVKENICNDFEYFSALRPFSELAIAQKFADLKPYHSIFTSCNQVFKIHAAQKNWCGACPKCMFVYLILATKLKKKDLHHIFGKDLLNDKSNHLLFSELLGIDANKPFECVGETDECRYAMYQLTQSDEWKGEFLVQHFDRKLKNLNLDLPALEKLFYSASNQHKLSNEMLAYLKAFILEN